MEINDAAVANGQVYHKELQAHLEKSPEVKGTAKTVRKPLKHVVYKFLEKPPCMNVALGQPFKSERWGKGSLVA